MPSPNPKAQPSLSNANAVAVAVVSTKPLASPPPLDPSNPLREAEDRLRDASAPPTPSTSTTRPATTPPTSHASLKPSVTSARAFCSPMAFASGLEFSSARLSSLADSPTLPCSISR
ncbi:hypothetical protein ACLB2K_056532 [Fragaria x ananassa]